MTGLPEHVARANRHQQPRLSPRAERFDIEDQLTDAHEARAARWATEDRHDPLAPSWDEAQADAVALGDVEGWAL